MFDARFEAILRSVAEITEDLVITSEQNLRNELGVDSLKLMDLIVNLESEYSIELSDDVSANVATVEELWLAVSREAG
ncbi:MULTISPECIES: acyl carrier protein [Streptomyces]|jgi:acyl carrier protein|uniref:Phosphopantetheine-binding protein n=1 Tax=Streptomyces glycanivorans TaxID=3033808 RepID=A0ABY9J748_9ACTN|nr:MULTISPECIES: phosphopantetheine-binding protein [unclassified Streptomyces]WLQ63435.1 phosphopantetheine-binding protein [Streptomyces sp. Alt3]WSR09789.1 phosphopantetheine-binding protein [Streptomyces sp. NBC_01208]WSR47487.1 phosphopantetheine-binding protein [Streptomyces sp. NBC_01201]